MGAIYSRYKECPGLFTQMRRRGNRGEFDALKAAGLRERVKVMVGGAPVTEAYAQQISADGYSPNAGRVPHRPISQIPAFI
jgi:hypothetical protein